MTRVVITGAGMISPLGVGLKQNWSRLIANESGLVSTTQFPNYKQEGWDQIPAKVVGVVPKGPLSEGKWNPDEHFTQEEFKRLAKFSQYGIACTQEAFKDAQLDPSTLKDPRSVGVAVGSGIGSIQDVYDITTAFNEGGYRKVQPLFIPKLLNNMAAGNISIKFGLKGPLHAVSTACATGLQAIGDAYNFIKLNYADVMVCGGSESSIHPLALAGFARARSLVTEFNDEPTKASRPFDKDRNGFVLSEGCGIVVLESLEHALKRGVTPDQIYGEIVGYGVSGDAHHITAPQDDGEGAYNAMLQALNRGKVDPQKVKYVNAHATSTVIGDRAENNALNRLFPASTLVSSTKGSIGHLQGAAGAVETIFTLQAIKTGQVPPTLNLDHPGGKPGDEPDKFSKFDYVANKAKEGVDVEYGMCNSFGFGGVNSSLLIGRYKE
ncbi:CEM1 [Candida theae]|uniref:3-oxoacyl-[acyl-carrier-protein] synthase n=1 Tax=Candida theae TaxID=1198502 RepID=A0AAD5B9V8_9ASCO|nr:CEM1 [Candida theae]KAI5948676.1 CEM1 [Candida theae]